MRLKYEMTLTVERNDIEQDVTVGFRFHPAFPGDHETPSDEAEFEIVYVKDENGNDFDLTKNEDAEAIENAFEEFEVK